MKTTLNLALAAILVASPLAFAKGDPQQREKRAAHMKEKFGVTDEQAAEMRRIRESGGSREEAAAVLTDEQRGQMRQWREEHRGQGEGARARRHRAGEVSSDPEA